MVDFIIDSPDVPEPYKKYFRLGDASRKTKVNPDGRINDPGEANVSATSYCGENTVLDCSAFLAFLEARDSNVAILRKKFLKQLDKPTLDKMSKETGAPLSILHKLNERGLILKYGIPVAKQLLRMLFSPTSRSCSSVSPELFERLIDNGVVDLLGIRNLIKLMTLTSLGGGTYESCDTFIGSLNDLQEEGKLEYFGVANLMELASHLKGLFPIACKYISTFPTGALASNPRSGVPTTPSFEWREVKDFIIRFSLAIKARNQQEADWLPTARALALEELISLASEKHFQFPLLHPEITFQDLVEFARISGIATRQEISLLFELLSVIGPTNKQLDMSEVLKIMRLSSPFYHDALLALIGLGPCLWREKITPAQLVKIAERERTNTGNKYEELLAQCTK